MTVVPIRYTPKYLVKTLIKHRDKILREYFTQYAPLDRSRLVRRNPGSLTLSLCYIDLAVLQAQKELGMEIPDGVIDAYKGVIEQVNLASYIPSDTQSEYIAFVARFLGSEGCF